MCGKWFHASNVCVKSPLTYQQTETNLYNICLSDALPFTSIDELDFNFTFGDFTRLPSAEDMDKLMHLKFNPFDDKQSSTDFSNSQILDNFNNTTCKYYLPKDISLEINNNKNFSILNFNIRSIVNKFDSFKFFLESFKNAFSVISLTETWLNNQNCEDFNLNNYHRMKIRFALNLEPSAKMEMPLSHLICYGANIWQIFKSVSVKRYPLTNALIFYYT